MRRKNKRAKLVALIFSLLLIGIGYAYLSANLKIIGTAKISNAKWDVHFENAVLVEVNGTTTFPSNSNSNNILGTPIIKGEDRQELEYEVIFNQPGDYYEFNVDIVNDGDIDAQLDESNWIFKIKIDDNDEIEIDSEESYNENWPSYLFYRFDSNDDIEYLSAGATTTLNIRLSIDKDISNEEWNNVKGKTIKITEIIPFIQSNGQINSNSNINNLSNENTIVRFENPSYVGKGTTTTVLSDSNIPKVINRDPHVYSETQHFITYEVVFNNPGDYYEYNIDLINEAQYRAYSYNNYGNIKIDDGEFEQFDYHGNINEKYRDIFEIQITEENEESNYRYIYAGDSRNFNIKLKVKDDISQEKLDLIKGKNLTIMYEILYVDFDSIAH